MVKKKKKIKTPEREKIDRAREELKSLEDLPLVGGLVKGLEKFVDLAEKVEEAGGEIKKRGEIKGKEDIKGIYGFSVRTGIGERPKIQTFGNIQPIKKGAKTNPQFKVTETSEPIVDVFDEKEYVRIVAELPGIEKEEIKLELRGDILNLEGGDEKRKYAKEILLPTKVDFEKREVNFKNGVLEIRLPKL